MYLNKLACVPELSAKYISLNISIVSSRFKPLDRWVLTLLSACRRPFFLVRRVCIVFRGTGASEGRFLVLFSSAISVERKKCDVWPSLSHCHKLLWLSQMFVSLWLDLQKDGRRKVLRLQVSLGLFLQGTDISITHCFVSCAGPITLFFRL